MKVGFEISTLGELCTFQRGLTYSKSDEVDISSTAVLRANNIDLDTNSLNFADMRYISDSVSVPESKRVKAGSLLICTASGSKSHLGKVAYIDQDYSYAFGGFMAQIAPGEKLEPRFLYYALTGKSFSDWLGQVSGGININNLKLSDIEHFPIPIPPLDEQRRIVAVLDKAFAGIATATANAQKNLANALELFGSGLNIAFRKIEIECEFLPLKEICDVRDGTHDTPKYVENGIPFVTQKNIRRDGLSFGDTKFISEIDHEKFYKRSNVADGDILISMIGANRGMSCLVDDPRTFSIKNVGLIKSNKKIDARYLLFFLNTDSAKMYIETVSRGGAQSFVGLTQLRSFPIPVAPFKQQLELVQKIEKLQTRNKQVEVIYQNKLAALSELKQSLLQMAFAGELI